jgi:hypothetical protein
MSDEKQCGSSTRHEKSVPHACFYKGGQITNPFLIRSAERCFQYLQTFDPSKRPPPFVLALDEAHVMTKRTGSSVPGPLLDILSSVMADLKEHSPGETGNIHFASIFLSTNTQPNLIAPTSGQIASERLSASFLAGVLTCVPWDIFVEQNKEWSVEEISTLKFISGFGRPL